MIVGKETPSNTMIFHVQPLYHDALQDIVANVVVCCTYKEEVTNVIYSRDPCAIINPCRNWEGITRTFGFHNMQAHCHEATTFGDPRTFDSYKSLLTLSLDPMQGEKLRAFNFPLFLLVPSRNHIK